jgi:transcriptional regulator
MFVPKINQMHDRDEILNFIQHNSFGILISTNTEGVPWATHIPIELHFSADGTPVLHGHLSRANPHARILEANPQALAIFAGAHAYVSSSWYAQESVSTWNYSAVHVYGTIRILDTEELLAQVSRLTERYESGVEKPLYVAQMTAEKVRKELRGIIGFEMSLDDIHAKAKLSQNRNPQDFQNIVHELEKTEDAQAHLVAAEMRKLKREDL